jgi:glutamate racemase
MDAPNRVLPISSPFWLGDGTLFDGSQLLSVKRLIVVFDSGVGGLTVARQIEELMPEADILYIVDNEWFPYGNKAGAAVATRLEQLIDRLNAETNPSAIIIACNTASTAMIGCGMDKVRNNCFLLTPPIDEAVDTSKNKNIVLLATGGTLKSKHVIQKIAEAGRRARIWPIATQSLVTLSEAKLAGEAASFAGFYESIADCLTEDERAAVDTVVLGCTHFPHLTDELRKVFTNAENWIDPARKMARQVASVIKNSGDLTPVPVRIVVFTSKVGVRKYHQVFSRNGFGAIRNSDGDRQTPPRVRNGCRV